MRFTVSLMGVLIVMSLSDVKSSVTTPRNLLEAGHDIVVSMHKYLDSEQRRIDDIKRIIQSIRDDHKKNNPDSLKGPYRKSRDPDGTESNHVIQHQHFVEHPMNALSVIKQWWPIKAAGLVDYATNLKVLEHRLRRCEVRLEPYYHSRYFIPKILDLQYLYNISTADMVATLNNGSRSVLSWESMKSISEMVRDMRMEDHSMEAEWLAHAILNWHREINVPDKIMDQMTNRLEWILQILSFKKKLHPSVFKILKNWIYSENRNENTRSDMIKDLLHKIRWSTNRDPSDFPSKFNHLRPCSNSPYIKPKGLTAKKVHTFDNFLTDEQMSTTKSFMLAMDDRDSLINAKHLNLEQRNYIGSILKKFRDQSTTLYPGVDISLAIEKHSYQYNIFYAIPTMDHVWYQVMGDIGEDLFERKPIGLHLLIFISDPEHGAAIPYQGSTAIKAEKNKAISWRQDNQNGEDHLPNFCPVLFEEQLAIYIEIRTD